jgi:rhamnosyltransferase
MSVTAIVVTFHPTADAVSRLIAALQHQVVKIVVVDNGSPADVQSELTQLANHYSIDLVLLPSNKGVGEAQNIGIAKATAHNTSYIILLDQDSLPASNMVDCLIQAAQAKQKDGIKVAAVGPCYKDELQDNPPPFIRIEGLRLKRQVCSERSQVVPVDYLISSGSLIPVTSIASVGYMKSELFIDYIDIEWGLRAKRCGLQSFGVCRAHMQHKLGENPIAIAGKIYPCRNPLRHYYMFRNAIYLYLNAPFPLNWKLADGGRLFLRFIAYSLLAPPRIQNVCMMLLGIWHGIWARMGPFKP